MIIIKVSSGKADLNALLLRQTPNSQGIWKNCRFIVNQPVDRCDWWVVCHRWGLRTSETTVCDPKHIVFISMEPEEGALPAQFLKQFSKLVLCDRQIKHSDILYLNCLTWWTGINVGHENGHHFYPNVNEDYDSFKGMSVPKKMKRISVICSNNRHMPGHFKRLAFLEKLRQHPIGKHIDFFGGGFHPILDKLDAIAPYKYHIALENSLVPDYWTEKLADSFLGFTLPIYYGCPNIFDYFSDKALKQIDLDNFDRSLAVLEELMDCDPYESYIESIGIARNQILDDYNIFNILANICNDPAERFTKCRLKSLSLCTGSVPRRLVRSVLHRYRSLRDSIA